MSQTKIQELASTEQFPTHQAKKAALIVWNPSTAPRFLTRKLLPQVSAELKIGLKKPTKGGLHR
ncbi:hypothetical protein [Photobacterium rosenbergii]|uniref:hypothetical protein n=1 Tax=Photobacterium rosenbergii TaxID=294936 RepID=UPI0011B23CB1|nr:hypothetical protein [Photobacterium rosenbergii]